MQRTNVLTSTASLSESSSGGTDVKMLHIFLFTETSHIVSPEWEVSQYHYSTNDGIAL